MTSWSTHSSRAPSRTSMVPRLRTIHESNSVTPEFETAKIQEGANEILEEIKAELERLHMTKGLSPTPPASMYSPPSSANAEKKSKCCQNNTLKKLCHGNKKILIIYVSIVIFTLLFIAAVMGVILTYVLGEGKVFKAQNRSFQSW